MTVTRRKCKSRDRRASRKRTSRVGVRIRDKLQIEILVVLCFEKIAKN